MNVNIFITKANQLYKPKLKQKAALIHYFSYQVKSPKKLFCNIQFRKQTLTSLFFSLLSILVQI